MTYRTVTVLAAALVVLGALALIAQYDPQPPAPGGGLLLPELGEDLDQVTQVTVMGAGSETVATLQRGDEGGWTIAERNGYPADVEKVRHTLISLAEARIVEPKTANPGFHDRLGVEDVASDDAGGLAVMLTGTDTPVDIIVGDTEGASQRYVRVAEQAQSFLIDRDPDVGSETTEWLATDIVAIPGSRVSRVTVTHPDGEVVSVSKADSEQTNFDVDAIPEGRELQYASIANVMGTVLSSLRLQDVESLTESDDPVTVTVTVTEFVTFDGLVITAESFERDDEPWVAFRAEYRPPAEAPAEDSASGAAADLEADAENTSDEIAADDAAEDDDGVDVAAEAQELDQRLAGWRYRIASYQFDQMTRRMDDLLRDLPQESAEDE